MGQTGYVRPLLYLATVAFSITLSIAPIVRAHPSRWRAAVSATGQADVLSGTVSPSRSEKTRVIVLLRRQFRIRAGAEGRRLARQSAIKDAQSSLLGELHAGGATRIVPFHLIDAVAATVTKPEIAYLRSQPAVGAVVPDAVVHEPQPSAFRMPVESGYNRGQAGGSTLSCGTTPLLEPEGLALTHTAFLDAKKRQAAALATGAGVLVALLADGIDPSNPDFIRTNGTKVFSSYRDFSGDGPDEPTNGVEAFGDASSIAAQGRQVYDVNDFLRPSQRPKGSCRIRIRGIAPGASLMGLKVFNRYGAEFTSGILQALQYAVDHGAAVINESFGESPFPDLSRDPISLANKTAVGYGVTVVASAGDSGTAGTLNTAATDPWVIGVGASTSFQLYRQLNLAGAQLGSSGYTSDNISSLSSGGISQTAQKTVDVVAPGDLGWALCSPRASVYAGCVNTSGSPSPIEAFGGSSEASPFVAGEAALVIQAFRDAHTGQSPSPAQVKRIIMSTASDLGAPSDEQGAGLVNCLRAVQAASSFAGSAAPIGKGLLMQPSVLSATGPPGAPQTFSLQVSNDGATAQTVSPTIRRLSKPYDHISHVVGLDRSRDGTFIDPYGISRAYVTRTFAVPKGSDRLDASIGWDVTAQPTAVVAMTLFDPGGRLTAYSFPQDSYGAIASGFGHVDVRKPPAGVWRAVIWTAAQGGYTGRVQFAASESRFVSGGKISPAAALIQPGKTAQFTVTAKSPSQAGDGSSQVVTSGAGAVPVILRSVVALNEAGGSFSGTLTGGNGRAGNPGQTLTYGFDVPAGKADLGLSVTLKDSSYNLQGVLVNPEGMPIDIQSTVTKVTSSGTRYRNSLQLYRRDPEAGRWLFILFINGNGSGRQTSTPFTGHIAFNTVKISSSGLPQDPKIQLGRGLAKTFVVNVKNTGSTVESLFVDPRLASTTTMHLATIGTHLPLTSWGPSFTVPPETNNVTVAALADTPNVPIDLDMLSVSGARPIANVSTQQPYDEIGSPDVEGTQFVGDNGNFGASATLSASEVPFGQWQAWPTLVGPFSGAAASVPVEINATATTEPFDATVMPSTGDAWSNLIGATKSRYAPLSLAPGVGGSIRITIRPDGAHGSVVRGWLYVDSFAGSLKSPITWSGDELAGIPYAYTVK